jgi:L-fucono-1,5-lactonase
MNAPVVDSHQHFWDPTRADYPWMTDDVAVLRRRFGPDDLEPLLRENGVAGSVVVQARHSLDETRELLTLAEETPFLLGVVGWVDLTGDVAAQLAELRGPLVGARHLVHDEPDPGWLLRDDVQRGIAALGVAGLAYDLLVRTRELPAAIETVRRHPETTFVLDHVAKRPPDDVEWAKRVAELAELPNVACKVSGVFTESRPQDTVARAIEWFGTDRCMFGSDWPVSLLAVDYADTLAIVGDDENARGLTAIRTYGLELA